MMKIDRLIKYDGQRQSGNRLIVRRKSRSDVYEGTDTQAHKQVAQKVLGLTDLREKRSFLIYTVLVAVGVEQPYK